MELLNKIGLKNTQFDIEVNVKGDYHQSNKYGEMDFSHSLKQVVLLVLLVKRTNNPASSMLNSQYISASSLLPLGLCVRLDQY